MTKRLIAIAQILLPVALLSWIVWRVWHNDPEAFSNFLSQPKRWGWLAASLAAYLSAILITFWRWQILVTALRLPFRLRDAIRLGFVGFFFQFLSLGTVGGDLFKAVFIAREQPARRPEAVATIFIDRAVGLLALLIVTSIAFVAIGWGRLSKELHPVAISCLVITFAGIIVVAGLLWTSATTRPLRNLFKSVPAIPAMLLRGEHALQMYRERRGAFMMALLSGMFSHSLLATSGYCAARGLLDVWPSFGNQIAIWNMAGAVGSLPLSPGGLGTLEVAYANLFEMMSANTYSDGVFVSFVIRIISLIVAGIGVAFYISQRREIRRLMDEAAEIEESDDVADQDANADGSAASS